VEQAFRWTKPAASSEIGVGDFEDLAASLFAFSATFEICRKGVVAEQACARS
jgi:hypothetical protein